MRYRASIAAVALAAALLSMHSAAQALDDPRYPDLKGNGSGSEVRTGFSRPPRRK